MLSLLLLFLESAPATADASMGGEWVLDASRSEGLPADMEQIMSVRQEGNVLHVKTQVVRDAGDRTVDDEYTIDGAEHPYPPVVSNAKATRTARWTEEGREFTTSELVVAPGANGSSETRIARHWILSPDNVLIIEMSTSGPTGDTRTLRRFVRRGAAATPSATAAASMPAGATPAPLFPVDLAVPIAPSSFRSGGKFHAVYELHVTNYRAGDIQWKRLDILSGETVLASYEGKDLDALISRPAAVPPPADPRRIGAGMKAVAYLWLSTPQPLVALRHRATFSVPSSASQIERIVQGPLVAVSPHAIVIGPPVRGRAWVARFNSNTSFHRRSLFPVDGRASISQRFAIDWNHFDETGREWRGEGKQNADYAVYGQEVIAVGDGTIAFARDGVAENVPPSISAAATATIGAAAGNHVVLRLEHDGHPVYATYAHLQTGSIRVREGDHVRRGEVLGRIGNSGNAVGPHLHFQISDSPGLTGEGLPFQIERFELLGTESAESAGSGEWKAPASAHGEKHTEEYPAEHWVVAF